MQIAKCSFVYTFICVLVLQCHTLLGNSNKRGRSFTVKKLILMVFSLEIILKDHTVHYCLFVILMLLSKFTQNTDKTQNWPVFYGIYLSTTHQFLNASCQDLNCLNQRLCKHDSNQMIRRLWISHPLSASEMTVCKR